MKVHIDYDNLKMRICRKARIGSYFIKSFIKWGFCSIVTGIICGFIGTAFYKSIAFVTAQRTAHPEFILGLPLAGLLIVALYKVTNMLNDGGTNRIIRSIRTEKPLQFRMAPLIFIGTVITHLFGGSAGREGAALQIGGSLGSTLGQILHLNNKDIHIVTMCGMSAVFAALFGTPITATIFSMEVISVGVLYYVAFIPCLFSSIVAYHIAMEFGVSSEAHIFASVPAFGFESVIQVIIISGICAVLSMVFCFTIHNTHTLFKKIFKDPFFRAGAGGMIIVILSLIVQTQDYNGAGMNVVADTLSGQVARPEAFILKIIFTAITLAAGFKGGEIVPSFFIGATSGSLIASLIGMDPAFGAAIGLIAMFCGVVNCPIASLFLSIELFGADGLVLFCFACAVSYVLSGYYGLYHSQIIVYSKLSPTYINKNTY